ncbi:hypothetical protein DL98DRAFT_577578 [Cadophora sp. DSE1049]|nr:hypothetical protein DL98DRAFT_577578 [Cadophora sp. DSE1049]
MDLLHNIRSLFDHVRKTYPATNNLVILVAITLLPIFTFTALALLIFHVYFTGNWFYYNELIFITRGFGEDDAAKCMDVLNETGLTANAGALEWYWRMQCEGNRDAWEGGSVLDMLNRRWVWMIFDTFWASFLGPCIYAVTYFATTASQMYNSEFAALIAAMFRVSLITIRNTILKNANFVCWLVSSWASYFDFVPPIKHAFATVGDWLQDSATTLANSKYWSGQFSEISSGVAESYLSFLWRYPVAFITAMVVILGDLLNRCTDYLVEITSNEKFLHAVSVIRNNLLPVLVPKTGMPWGFIALVFSIWINVYMHRNFIYSATPNRSRREYWTKGIAQIPFAPLNVLCFGSGPPPGADELFRQSLDDNNGTPAYMEWYWDEVPELALQKVILPIAYRGVWDGFRYWVYNLVRVLEAVARGSKRLSMTTAGSAMLVVSGASYIYLLVAFPLFRYAAFRVSWNAPNFLLVTVVITILVFVLLEVFRIINRAITTIFIREPFTRLNPWGSGFWGRINPVLLSQITILVILRLFNSLTSIMRVPLTLIYTECLIYAMAFDTLEIGDTFQEFCDLDVVARILAMVLYHTMDWVPGPWFWRPNYFLGALPIPFFAWYTGYVTTAIYHSLYTTSRKHLFEDLYVGFFLLMSYLRIPGHEYFLKYSTLQLKMDLRGAVITKHQAFVLVLAIVITGYLASVNLQAAIYYILLWAVYFLRDPKLPYPPPNYDPNNSLDTVPGFKFLHDTLKKALGVPITYLAILPILFQLSGEPYMDLESLLYAIAGAGATYGLYHLSVFLHHSGPTQQEVLKFIKLKSLIFLAFTVLALAWLSVRLTGFPLRQQVVNATSYLIQQLTLVIGALASYFTYIRAEDDTASSRLRATLECIVQIGAALFTLYALTYLTFTLAFYAVAVLGLLLFFYCESPATANSARFARPHGVQAVFWDKPVPAWAKHLWWIIPSWAVWESVQIVQHSEAIHQHFRDYNFEFFSEAWASSSIIATIAVVISMILTFLVHIMEEPHTLEFLWTVGNLVTSYLPFITRPLRDALFFRAGSGATYQGRKPVDLIQAWIVLVLQAYSPGAWSLVVSMLVWDIIKVDKPSTGSPTPETPVQDDDGNPPSNDEIGLSDDQRAEAAAAAAERMILTARTKEQRQADVVEDDLPTEITEHARAELELELELEFEAEAEAEAAREKATEGKKERQKTRAKAGENEAARKKREKDEADAIRAGYLEEEQARLTQPKPFSTLVDTGSADDFGLDPEEGGEDQVPSEDDEVVNPGNRHDSRPESLEREDEQLPMQLQSTIKVVPEPKQLQLAAQTGSGPSIGGKSGLIINLEVCEEPKTSYFSEDSERLGFDIWTLFSWAAPGIFNWFTWLLGWLPYVLLLGSFPAFVFWRFNIDSVNAVISDLYMLSWLDAGAIWSRIVEAVASFCVNLLVGRCIHIRTCTCFEGLVSIEDHDKAVAEVEPGLRAQMLKSQSDLRTKNSNIFLLNQLLERWRRRAEAAEELVATCRLDHVDFVGLNTANRRFRSRVDELDRENGDLRMKYNLERRNKGRHPLFDDLPSNLEERNRDLRQENNILQEDLKTAREELARRPFPRDERMKSEAEIEGLNLIVTRQEEKIDKLRAENEELERHSRMTDDNVMESLRDRIFDLQNQLRVSTAQQDALRAKDEAEAIIAAARAGLGEVHDGEGQPGIPNCVRCTVLQNGKLEAEERLRTKTGQLEAFEKTCEDSVTTIKTVLERLEEAQQEIDRLERLDPPVGGWSEGDAAKELTHIYDRLKNAMIEIKKAEPGHTVNLETMFELIDLIPHLFKFQEDTIAGYAAHQEELTAAYQQIEMFEDTIKDYNDAAREARETLDPGTATDPNYDIMDFIHHAVTAVITLNTKIEQQMLFNRSTPNDQHKQLEALQAENIGLKVKISDSAYIYDKAVKEADRLRMAFQTQAINSRRPEDKRRHAVYNNLEIVFRETHDFMDAYKMSYPEFVLPNWVENLLPSQRETEDLSQKLRQVVFWMQEEGWPGSKPNWHGSSIEGSPPSIDDQLGLLLKPLMERVGFALEELQVHNNEVWTNSKAQKQDPASSDSRPEGCTCPPRQSGRLRSCPVCAAFEHPATGSEPNPSGTFTDQMNRSLNTRGGGRRVDSADDANSPTWPPRHDSPRSPFSSPNGPLNPSRSSRPYTRSFGARRDTSSSSNPTNRPPAPKAPPFSGDTFPLPLPPEWPDVETGDDFLGNATSSRSRGSGTNSRPSPPGFSPIVESPAGSDTASPSAPNEDGGPVLDENPEYWRSGHKDCELLWAEIQGLQEGLRAHGVDVTRYKWLGETIEYLDAAKVDGMRRRRDSNSSLVETQGDALQWQRNALELEVWEKYSPELGSWEDSPHNPENKPPNQQQGNMDMGEQTGWERMNVQQGCREIVALQTELERHNIDCGDVYFVDVADIINLSGYFIGRKMTMADVLSKQLNFVTTQLVELQEIWERNVSTLGPRSALPFYRAQFSSGGIAGAHTPQHDWRKDPQCIKLWDWVIGIQRHLRKREIRGWKELKTWQVDGCKAAAGDTILASQTSYLAKHIQRLQNVWFAKEDVLGKTFTFRNRNMGWQLDWANS